MGTRFSVYVYNKETNVLLPPSIARDAMYVTDVAPADRWNHELLEDDGEQKMRELVSEVKAMCEEIKACAWACLLHRSFSIIILRKEMNYCYVQRGSSWNLNFRVSLLSVHECYFS